MCVSFCYCTFTKYLYSKYPCCCCCCCCCVFFYHYHCLFLQSNQTSIIMIAKVFIVLALCLVAAQAFIIRGGGFQPRFNQVVRPYYGGRFLYGGDFDGMLTLWRIHPFGGSSGSNQLLTEGYWFIPTKNQSFKLWKLASIYYHIRLENCVNHQFTSSHLTSNMWCYIERGLAFSPFSLI